MFNPRLKRANELPRWFVSDKVEIKESPGKGLGVFAKDKILRMEIFESAPVVLFSSDIRDTLMDTYDERLTLMEYPFRWPCKTKELDLAFSLGYGGVYNHAHEKNSNARWECVTEKKEGYNALRFIAKRVIHPGEEICTTYNNDNGLWFISDDMADTHFTTDEINETFGKDGILFNA
jgi:SET domain-containing protein